MIITDDNFWLIILYFAPAWIACSAHSAGEPEPCPACRKGGPGPPRAGQWRGPARRFWVGNAVGPQPGEACNHCQPTAATVSRNRRMALRALLVAASRHLCVQVAAARRKRRPLRWVARGATCPACLPSGCRVCVCIGAVPSGKQQVAGSRRLSDWCHYALCRHGDWLAR